MMRALLDEFSKPQDQHAIRLGWQQRLCMTAITVSIGWRFPDAVRTGIRGS
jgi:hypothetical protein